MMGKREFDGNRLCHPLLKEHVSDLINGGVLDPLIDACSRRKIHFNTHLTNYLRHSWGWCVNTISAEKHQKRLPNEWNLILDSSLCLLLKVLVFNAHPFTTNKVFFVLFHNYKLKHFQQTPFVKSFSEVTACRDRNLSFSLENDFLRVFGNLFLVMSTHDIDFRGKSLLQSDFMKVIMLDEYIFTSLHCFDF